MKNSYAYKVSTAGFEIYVQVLFCVLSLTLTLFTKITHQAHASKSVLKKQERPQ